MLFSQKGFKLLYSNVKIHHNAKQPLLFESMSVCHCQYAMWGLATTNDVNSVTRQNLLCTQALETASNFNNIVVMIVRHRSIFVCRHIQQLR